MDLVERVDPVLVQLRGFGLRGDARARVRQAAAAGHLGRGVGGDVDDLDALGGCRGAPARGRRVRDKVGYYARGGATGDGSAHRVGSRCQVPAVVVIDVDQFFPVFEAAKRRRWTTKSHTLIHPHFAESEAPAACRSRPPWRAPSARALSARRARAPRPVIAPTVAPHASAPPKPSPRPPRPRGGSGDATRTRRPSPPLWDRAPTRTRRPRVSRSSRWSNAAGTPSRAWRRWTARPRIPRSGAPSSRLGMRSPSLPSRRSGAGTTARGCSSGTCSGPRCRF